MNSLPAALCAVLLVLAAACACCGEPAGDPHTPPAEPTLVGQLLLPSGSGSRGVELLATIEEDGSEPRITWVLFDEQGHFSHTFRGRLTRFQVMAGLERQVHGIDAGHLPEANHAGQLDLGVIDLREQLARHRLSLRAADGKPTGDVKVAMWFGLPPVGPQGEPVALGSRQFPAIALGSEMEWLLPHDAQSVYFLVERPAGPGRGRAWRSGRQRLFGPFVESALPAELVMD